jgi:hypothetical protein
VESSAYREKAVGSFKVGQMITAQYREDLPRAFILANALGVYRKVLAKAAASLGLMVLPLPGQFSRFRRSWRSQPDMSEPISFQYQSGDSQTSGPSTSQDFIKKYSERAIGVPEYPSPRIGLKEALLLLHLRNTSPEFRDAVEDSDKAHHLQDHMVVAAMLMDLILQGRITIERGLLGRKTIQVTAPLPVGDPDTDALLERLRVSHRSLKGTYESEARKNWVARLTDQLRKAGYVRLYEPVSGRFSYRGDMLHSPFQGMRVVLASVVGFRTGQQVATDDYTRILPWQFLYTSCSAEEEAIFARVQSAITLHSTPDDFTRALLLLIAALYVENTLFQDYSDDSYNKSIYRFYAPHERKAVVSYLRDLARETQGGLRDIFQIARALDLQIDGPHGDSPT